MIDKKKKRTILIIDDTVANLKTAMTYLEAYSFEIRTARNGTLGLERASLLKPDLILLDVQMPGLDGFETCRRLKANPDVAHIPVIFTTVASDTAAKVKGLEVGAIDYLIKPFDAAELLARVNTHIALAALQQELETLVQERTAALSVESERRQQQQREKEALWQTIHDQNEQFRTLTRRFLENHQRHNLNYDLNQNFGQNLQLLHGLLTQTQTNLAMDNIQPHRDGLLDQTQQMVDIVAHLQEQTEHFVTLLNQEEAQRDTLLQNLLMQLSDREQEVIHLLIAGKSTSEIANLLTLSPGTVSTYRRRIMEKLNVSDLASLIHLVNNPLS